ncbi:hypothetical protein T459_29770 [Capsicum annuum]|uniref:Uncharacterized protein n=1 Tax=Capsicum annuum TaxID=4072 RepID=A0A2G2Y6F4_CAPAN|nr:hypothetical protein T459_29770 [Capsicum annuum]
MTPRVCSRYIYSNMIYINSLIVTTKGLDLELPRVFTTYMIIDLPRNRFEGHIPIIIGDLFGLRALNLSHNGLERNEGLCGLPLSKDCGSDDGERDLISWQPVLMGYSCGLFIGLSIIYIMLSTHYPV